MLKVLNPFGPKIAKLKLSKHLVNKINKEVDEIVSNKLLANRLDYSKKLVGQVKQEISLPKSFIKRNLEKIISKKKLGYECAFKERNNYKTFFCTNE